MERSVEITRVVEEEGWSSDRLLELLYDELRELASARLRRLPPGSTLQPTALVHEAYMRLAGGDDAWSGRAHFFGAAARAMRNVLVDRARRRAAARHGGGRNRITLDTEIVGLPKHAEDEMLLALDDALDRLAALNERQGRTVVLLYYGGLTQEQAAELLGVSTRTVERDWRFAKAWLQRELEQGADGEAGGE
ncbi:MAG: sigma-70 family RNA polymerase sigma factor [Phycisphaeraceae bacterium]|nr:MAG: sigma-70 family RNA polymerase sigma factor [Phycisphaeraceae bacterium]